MPWLSLLIPAYVASEEVVGRGSNSGNCLLSNLAYTVFNSLYSSTSVIPPINDESSTNYNSLGLLLILTQKVSLSPNRELSTILFATVAFG